MRQRQRLIDACISALHLYGPSRTTVEKVVALADLSPGIVRFYFDSKDAMLVASLAYLAAEFEERVLVPVGELRADPVRALERLVELYLDPEIASPRKVSVWYCFWGEASSRQEYYEICGKKDDDFAALVRDLVERLIALTPDSHLDADAIALGLMGVLEVLWQTIAFQVEENVDREQARRRSMAYLCSVFPGRFEARAEAPSAPAQAGHAAQMPPPLPGHAPERTAQALPASSYADPALLARERAVLLRPTWQLMGHQAELVRPGEFLARDLAGERALALRDEAGRLRAFRNACPHRPHALVDQVRGRLKGPLRCAAHQLAFGWDGQQLAGHPVGPLVALELMQQGPLIFVRAERPGAPAQVVPESTRAPALEPLVSGSTPVSVREVSVAADWKVLVEQWLDATPQSTEPTRSQPLRRTVLLPNQLLELRSGVLEILQVIPEAPGRCRLRSFTYRTPGRRTARGRTARRSLKEQIAQAESTQLGMTLAGESCVPLAAHAPQLESFRGMIRALLPGLEARGPDR